MTVVPPSRQATWSRENAYTALWSVDPRDDLFREVERQFSSWIRDRRQTRDWDPALEDGVSTGPNAERLLVAHRDSSQGKTLRLKLDETNNAGNWRTSLTAHLSAHGDSWILVHTGTDGFTRAKPPRVARLLLGSIEVRDAETWLSDHPRKVYTGGVDELADEITHIERQIPFLVVGTSGVLPFDAFVDRVARWTKDTVGLAQVAILDPAATSEFNEIVGPDYAVPTETIRTFLPGVDPAISIDGRRHRILSTSRLAGSDGVVRKLLGDIAFRHAARRIFPTAVRAELRAMIRVEDTLLLDSVFTPVRTGPTTAAGVGVPPEVVTPLDQSDYEAPSTTDVDVADVHTSSAVAVELETQLETVRTILNVSEISESVLLGAVQEIRAIAERAMRDQAIKQLEEKEQQIGQLRLELEESQDAYEQMDFDLALANSESDKAIRETKWLRGELAKYEASAAYAAAPVDESDKRPENILDLCDMLDDFAGRDVVFTGSVDDVIALATYDGFGRIAGSAWDCLVALVDYVAARNAGDFTRGIYDYLKNPPGEYRTVPVTRFAATESETVQNGKKTLQERTFAVPTTVHESGSAVMLAHFKIASIATISPRIYVYDNWTADGKVYVGYIGRHLTNTMTN